MFSVMPERMAALLSRKACLGFAVEPAAMVLACC
jgi:hypothetical protein